MKTSVAHSSSARGQTTLEYLLLLAVVAVIVIASFGPGALVSQVHDSAQSYYNTVTNVIMGANPQPINGGWCPATAPSGSGPAVMYRSCECPAPAFGGAYCQGSSAVTTGATACGPCPTGQVCNSSGQCGCPNNLVCGQGNGPTGSIPSTDCTQCICPSGTTYDKTDNSCNQNCPQHTCTTWNGTSCVAVTCGANMNCNPAMPSNEECQCNKGSIYTTGPGCVACPSCTTNNSDYTACVSNAATACQSLPGTWCDPAMPPSQECACDKGLTWNGNGCS